MKEESTIFNAPRPPRGLLRILARLPIWLYWAKLGWLLGNRFLMLTHVGRRSGRQHDTVVEVVRYDTSSGIYVIVSGFGERTDWFLNISQTPQVTVHVGRRAFAAIAERLPLEDALREFKDYARRHPTAAKALARVLGYPWDGSEASYQQMARRLPVIALQPDTHNRRYTGPV